MATRANGAPKVEGGIDLRGLARVAKPTFEMIRVLLGIYDGNIFFFDWRKRWLGEWYI